jgi:DNA-directed RNA polymerase subunit F
MEITEEKFVSWAEARKILEKKEKERELGYEQKNALDHLRKYSKMNTKKAGELAEKLRKNERLNDRHVTNILDHLPKNLEEVNVLFSNEIITLSDDDKKAIIKAVSEFS